MLGEKSDIRYNIIYIYIYVMEMCYGGRITNFSFQTSVF